MNFIAKMFQKKSTRAISPRISDIIYMGDDQQWYNILNRLANQGLRTTNIKINGSLKKYPSDIPYLVIVDILNLPKHNINKILRKISNYFTYSRIICVSASPTWQVSREAIKSGAEDFLAKTYNPAQIADVIQPFLKTPKL